MNLLPTLEVSCCDLKLSNSMFHSTDAALANPCLSMSFLLYTEEIDDSLFPLGRLLDLIRDNKWGDL